MEFLRTPDDRFEGLSGYPFAPHYIDVPAADGDAVRMHYVDEGPREGRVLLLLHGEPTWSFQAVRIRDIRESHDVWNGPRMTRARRRAGHARTCGARGKNRDCRQL